MTDHTVEDLHHKEMHRPCPKCGAREKVFWIISFYYCETCHQRDVSIPKEVEPVQKKRHTRKKKS